MLGFWPEVMEADGFYGSQPVAAVGMACGPGDRST